VASQSSWRSYQRPGLGCAALSAKARSSRRWLAWLAALIGAATGGVTAVLPAASETLLASAAGAGQI